MHEPTPFRLIRETFRLAIRRPATWFAWLVLACVYPLLSTIAAIGISADFGRESGLSYDIAFIALLVGTVRGTNDLARIAGVVSCTAARPTLVARVVVIAGYGSLHLAIALLPAVLSGETLESGWRLALVLLAVAALGALLLRLPLPAGSSPWVLGVGALVAPLFHSRPLPNPSIALLAVALLGAGWLLDHPPGRAA